ncbi:hypothetical protein JOQ06_018908 [Pogonophryne albipinna]|uniref:Uncharacterized protein n=1 Tax=Pogonophryne albipinna TaxID=1090488 RepID=A0AAD6ASC0_9TELE|nr:hypothetical protein JOQ06_018908 [Pogonophryne albipinna]
MLKPTVQSGNRSSTTTATSDRSTPACSPVLRKRSRTSTPQLSPDADCSMVEKGSSDQALDRSPTTEQTIQHQRSTSQALHPTNSSSRSGGKNSKHVGHVCSFLLLLPLVALSLVTS